MTKNSLLWALALGVALGVSAVPVLAQTDGDPGGTEPEDPGPPDPEGRGDDDGDDTVSDDSDPGGFSPEISDPGPEIDDRDEPGSSGPFDTGSGGPDIDDTDNDTAAAIEQTPSDDDGNWLAGLFSGRGG